MDLFVDPEAGEELEADGRSTSGAKELSEDECLFS
jgi:hypothetical protein